MAAMSCQKLLLSLKFNAFCNDAKTQAFGQGDNRLGNRRIIGIGKNIPNEGVEKPQFSQKVRVRRRIANWPNIFPRLFLSADYPVATSPTPHPVAMGSSPTGYAGHCAPNQSKRIAVMR